MIEKVKEIRVNIDALIQVVQSRLEHWNHNVQECNKSLLLGKMWLGKALGAMDEESPYQNGNDITTNKIDPRADVAVIIGDLWEDIDMSDEVILTKRLREEIDKEILILGNRFAFNNTSTDLGTYVNASRLHLAEARMWLGEYLSYKKRRVEEDLKFLTGQAEIAYESYVDEISKSSAPGTKFDLWEELSPGQKDAWRAVVSGKHNPKEKQTDGAK